MKEKFRRIRLSLRNQQKLARINSIIQEYKDDGYVMTLRQLYYQLVSRDIIPNVPAEYSKLSKLLVEGRMAGLVDWGAIEDRLRVPNLPYYNESPAEAVSSAANMYRLDRQEGQDHYIEVWVEKDALSGVIKRVTHKYHVKLLVNRGYGSVTAVHDAYRRFSSKLYAGKTCTILYLGDHDPSGMEMIRDLDTRVNEMLLEKVGSQIEVKSIALTMEQIRQYDPPENPAKLSDPRAGWYLDRFGRSSWEVDALEPKVLNELISSNIENTIDMDIYNSILEKEIEDKEKLEDFADKFL